MELNRGSEKSTLDDKGRVNIPARFRSFFQGELIITWGMERCAWIMTPPLWEHFEQALRNSDSLAQAERLILEDKHLNQAKVVELDKTGRIAVPASTREYAGLTGECMVIWTENRLAIWDNNVFSSYLTAKDEVAKEAMNKLGSLDLFRVGRG